ncbi:MAG: hypothetical protein HY255_10835, partial [Betaproteobacteria bacterium]|nr:hypothetical protein [Betaproteobacteria bacterium]
MTNQFGLPRAIPEHVRREVRQRSRFGCILCRSAIYQYEHIYPEFANAKAHEADKICLLCGGCHDKVSRGRIAKDTVKTRYLEIQESNEVRPPFEELSLSSTNISVAIGSANFEHTPNLIRINGQNLLSITPPKDGAAFPTLNGIFCDHAGRESLRIVENVWEGAIDAWDISVAGRVVTVRTEKGRTALAFRIDPPSRITISELDMYLENCRVYCGKKGLVVGQFRAGNYTYLELENIDCKGAEIGIDIDSVGADAPRFRGLSIVGGEGIRLEGTGIRIGVGAGSMI